MMVREPVAGRVKTRLAREAGTAATLRFYRTVTANLIRRLGDDPRWRLVLAVSPDSSVHSRSWRAPLMRLPQGSGDLGARMELLLRQRGPLATIVIGSDIPGIMPAHIAEAFHKLGGADAILGPAEDGGYWLVGIKPHCAATALFRNVRWSSPHALEDTLGNLDGHQVAFAATLEDVDGAASLRRIGHLGTRVTPPRGSPAR